MFQPLHMIVILTMLLHASHLVCIHHYHFCELLVRDKEFLCDNFFRKQKFMLE